MASSGMLHRVALVRTDVSEELSASIIRVTKLVFLHGLRQLLVTVNVPSSPILVTLMIDAVNSSKTYVLTRDTWRNIPADDILHSHRRENLKSCKIPIVYTSFIQNRVRLIVKVVAIFIYINLTIRKL
jgi:hypothetical protein